MDKLLLSNLTNSERRTLGNFFGQLDRLDDRVLTRFHWTFDSGVSLGS